MSVWIVIAAYNEEKSIAGVVKNLIRHGYKNIIVVDDGSADNTFSFAKKAGANVVQHKVNQGQGAALRTGIQYALSKGADYIITYDADGQHRVEDIPRLLAPVQSGNYDIALGSRFLKGSKTKVPFVRLITLKGSIFVLYLFYGIKLTDAHNGFRAMSRKAAQKIKITCNRMAHASEFIEEIKRNKLRYKEVPVTILYTEHSKRKGQSSLNSFRILWQMIKNKIKTTTKK